MCVGGPPQSETLRAFVPSPPTPQQDPLPPTRAQRWAALANHYLDTLTYTTLFLFIGLPIYYALDYAMPAHLTLSILTYFSALSIPAKYKCFLHPVLVSSAFTILGIWILALSHRSTLRAALTVYTTKSRYIQLFNGQGSHLTPPGAGDIFGSVLDVRHFSKTIPIRCSSWILKT